MSLKAAVEKLNSAMLRSMAATGSLSEADGGVNDASRAVIAAMAGEHGGVAWLVDISAREGRPTYWQWDGNLVYNFGASHVLPFFDDELAALVLAFRANPSRPIIGAIQERMATLGGETLLWS